MSKTKDNTKEIMLHFETVVMAYKKGAVNAPFICSLIFPEICSKHDGLTGSSTKNYKEWWELNFSPLVTIPINEDRNLQYHISGVVGNAIRCATFHEAKFDHKDVVKEFEKYYGKKIDTDKEIRISFNPNASHYAFLLNEENNEITIELSLNQQNFVYNILMFIEKNIYGKDILMHFKFKHANFFKEWCALWVYLDTQK